MQKGTGPAGLIEQHARDRAAPFDVVDKQPLRDAAFSEQGGLCCYCMRPLRPTWDRMKMEHWRPQVHEETRFAWSNLFGACLGGEGQRKALQTCDTRKGDAEIKVHPGRQPETWVRFNHATGELFSDDEVVQRDLDVTLNLNDERLCELRKEALDAFLARTEGRGKKWSAKRIEAMLGELNTPGADGRLQPFVGVMERYLRKRRARM